MASGTDAHGQTLSGKEKAGDSIFLKVPLEVRLEVYEILKEDHLESDEYPDHYLCLSPRPDCLYYYKGHTVERYFGENGLDSLLCTCTQIRDEVLQAIRSWNKHVLNVLGESGQKENEPVKILFGQHLPATQFAMSKLPFITDLKVTLTPLPDDTSQSFGEGVDRLVTAINSGGFRLDTLNIRLTDYCPGNFMSRQPVTKALLRLNFEFQFHPPAARDSSSNSTTDERSNVILFHQSAPDW
ncbi:hypothetical protein GGR50DRAFT_695200 [Xylaria sp. CBS 124048]|nr:hypothetical protein GGR50DRAFT_695200 [Xylaria sp. CBS 124048]